MQSLLAYAPNGDVVAGLDYMVARDESGAVVGLIDFAAHEAAGGKLRDIWRVEDAAGSATWPEWLGGQAHAFRVELTGKKITALVHKASGYRRERAAVEEEIAKRIEAAAGKPADLRDLVGGPTRPLVLDAGGKTAGRSVQPGTRLPVLGGVFPSAQPAAESSTPR